MADLTSFHLEGLYQPLPSSRSIRLIRFLPSSTLTCYMITVEVEKAPPYVALSYTWGSQSRRTPILINGFRILISRNLAKAIHAVGAFVKEENLFFWADSICINQNDVRERGVQVRLMNSIYRSAEYVTVWLGSAENDSDLAFKKMKSWKARVNRTKQENGIKDDDLVILNIRRDDPAFFGSDQPAQKRLKTAFHELFLRDWWNRAWVVQEGTASNPTRTLLFCGNQSTNWECFRVALNIMQFIIFRTDGADFKTGMPLRLNTFRQWRESGRNVRLLDILQLMRVYLCEDPRDKVYASIGMAMDVQVNSIIPDYTKSRAAVYRDVVTFLTERADDHSLDFLGEVIRSDSSSTVLSWEEDPELPSWVPDWGPFISVIPFPKHLNAASYGSERAYNACGSSYASPGNCIIEGNKLRLRGSVIDEIAQMWRTCEAETFGYTLDEELSWMPTAGERMYIAGGTIMEAFNHTLVADIGRKDLDDPDQFARGFAVDWGVVNPKPEKALRGPARLWATLSKPKRKESRSELEMGALARQKRNWMFEDIKTVTFGRKLFLTKRGYIGLGPAAVQINDKICVLFRGQVLYALREKGDNTYEFMGECYVHGMMDGQALRDIEFRPQEFILV
ncbi:HET-domain-containing protein [Lojkania enalia]|uniref:HET-domain-containing protein n=1 Tax=Lojkania enalia TaxID=147567 RepID=A0A9P4NAP7_9PLEO|nr:HET-domain-containing protein [Didymosphaeria enalia]